MGLAMAALTICAGLPKAFPQAPRLPVASESQAPTGAGARAPPYSAAAQPKTSTTTPQTATAAAHSRLPRHAGLASNRFRCRAAAPGRAAGDPGASGSRTGVVDTIATSSLAPGMPGCHPAADPPARHEPCGGQIAGHRTSGAIDAQVALQSPVTGPELPYRHMPLRYVNIVCFVRRAWPGAGVDAFPSAGPG